MPFEGPRARAARHAREGKAAKRKQIAAAAMEQSGSNFDDSVANPHSRARVVRQVRSRLQADDFALW